MNNKTLKKMMACLALLSSYSINVQATEKKEIKQNIRRENDSMLKHSLPYFGAIGIIGSSLLLRSKLSQSATKLHNQNLTLKSQDESLQKANSAHEEIKKVVNSKVIDSKKENATTTNIINDIQTKQFDKSEISDENWNNLVEKIKILIPDEIAKAYNCGDVETKRKISKQVAEIIDQYNQNKVDYAINEMQKLDKLSEASYLEKEGILKPIMSILSTAVDMISKLDMAGIKLFNEDETNADGLTKYFQGIVDYLIPTEGDPEKLKLAKFIKKAATIVLKHYDNKKSLKELVQPLFGSSLSNDQFGEIFLKKLEQVINMPD